MRRERDRVDGVLLLDKPSGASSNAVLQRTKRLFNAAKAGHTGTLDPLASGLLPICFGEATKFAQALLDARKEYVATVRFGIGTTTGDAEGEIVGGAAVSFDTDLLTATLGSLLGASQQVPPAYSALKFRGRSHYEYARAGVEVPRAPRSIFVDRLDLLEHTDHCAVLRVGCSKGTYVRTLVEDIAKALGTLGHLTALRRTATGPFRLDHAHRLEKLETMDPAERRDLLLPVDAALMDLPCIDLSEDDSLALVQGRAVSLATTTAGGVRAYDPAGAFLGVAEAAAGVLRAVRLVATSPATGRAGVDTHLR